MVLVLVLVMVMRYDAMRRGMWDVGMMTTVGYRHQYEG